MQYEQALKEESVAPRAHACPKFPRNRAQLIDPQRTGGILRQPQQVGGEEVAEVGQRAAHQIPARQTIALHIPRADGDCLTVSCAASRSR